MHVYDVPSDSPRAMTDACKQTDISISESSINLRFYTQREREYRFYAIPGDEGDRSNAKKY